MIGGSPLVGILTNLVLMPLDRELESAGVRWQRYGDDVLILNNAEISGDLKGRIDRVFAELQLDINLEKKKTGVTVSIDVDDVLAQELVKELHCPVALALQLSTTGWFDFLGYMLFSNQVLVRDDSMHKIRNKIQEATHFVKLGRLSVNRSPAEVVSYCLERLCHKTGFVLGSSKLYRNAGAARWLGNVRGPLVLRQCRELDAFVLSRLGRAFDWGDRDLKILGREIYDRGWRGYIYLYRKLHGHDRWANPADGEAGPLAMPPG